MYGENEHQGERLSVFLFLYSGAANELPSLLHSLKKMSSSKQMEKIARLRTTFGSTIVR